jgi:hypothetical protein
MEKAELIETAVVPVNAAADVEEWLVSTPDEPKYYLQMDDDGGTVVQDVDLTREEYIRLKSFLASLRGLTFAEAAAA